MRVSSLAAPPDTLVSTAIADIQRLRDRAPAWLAVSPDQRIHCLQRIAQRTKEHAAPWVDIACQIKGVDPDGPWAGEEWISGPLGLLLSLEQYIHSLKYQGVPPVQSWRRGPNGEQIAQILPRNWQERCLWLGFKAEVWLEPGKPRSQGRAYREPGPARVALVLGAGNTTAIAPIDALYKLIGENQVVLLKMNPINAALGPCLEIVFEPLISAGFMAIAYGGGDLGAFLCQHPAIDTIHITGSHHTHDRIVWGKTGEEQERNKAQGTPILKKPITSELGNVTPIMVVPGPWSPQDMAYHARQVASMVVHNASFNCVAAQVLITAKHWPLRQSFLDALQQALARMPPRPAYYPGAIARYQEFLHCYPQAEVLTSSREGTIPWTFIPGVPPQPQEMVLEREAFCGLLAEVALDCEAADQFLAEVVPFANDHLWGTLGCALLIHPASQRQYAMELEGAIAQLRYGTIALNAWPAVSFSLACTTWGAYPCHTLENVGSGLGVVHNSYLFDYPLKSILRVPFRLPLTPPWFNDHRNLVSFSKAMMNYYVSGNPLRLLSILSEAIKA
ncbi:NAD-dependent aldehyde dehydrogenase [Candidatus Synechococcus calcipolaris G9]|uniref:NAD-dependent aldehyde dehydrogenase n=1 Tax=Candidatus Synechococcus calcipolaris G9 TaxID=1497997 RepID=A0ABT6F372_9SYNE|nr:NAD-dependent aldehyde dehydrogenase [Candidatus Synechococcus calcipolaris]MDG2992236.1 NAD-dependent aldehyde dehydrogenase [Candidatus Synechococcus calcipolaris G9]